MAEETIIGQLRECAWRGIEFPITGDRTFGFVHDQADHRFIYRNEQIIESLGRKNPTYRYRIPFREGIRQFGWKNLFTVVYPKFLAACLDPSAGELIDCLHGPKRVKCASLSEVLSVEATDGVEVSADFVFAPLGQATSPSDFSRIASNVTGFQASAFQYDADGEALTDEQKREIREFNPELKKEKVNPFTFARQVAGTVQQYKTRAQATLGSYAAQLERTRDDIEEARDPELEPLRRQNSRLIRATRELDVTLAKPPGPFGTYVTESEMGRLAVATYLGISPDKLLSYNPGMAEMMSLPKGMTVYFPKPNG